jgi:Putative peptidoglycan binding domain
MKRIVLLTFIGSLALALTGWGAPREKHANRAAKSKSAHVVSTKSGGHAAKARTSQSVRPRGKTHSVTRPNRTGRSRMEAARTRSARTVDRSAARKTAARSRTPANRERMQAARTRNARTAERAARTRTAVRSRTTVDRERAVAGEKALRSARPEAARTRAELNRERAQARADTQRRIRTEKARVRAEQTVAARTRAAARTNLAVNRQRNLTFARNVALNRDNNVRIVNNWRNDWFRDGDYAPFYNYNRVWHDRWWWKNNYTNIVFVFGGWWYWNTGYWYPAWGYDPYGWYSYDGPIYTGYASVTPDQVMVNVQVALRDWGYYAGPIDGIIGTQSRAALAAFQADNGLAVTSAVDKPTLQTLGLA